MLLADEAALHRHAHRLPAGAPVSRAQRGRSVRAASRVAVCPRSRASPTGTSGTGRGPSVLRVRDPRALPAGPTQGPIRNGGGAGLITVRQVPATAARESNL
jgi:hypothetical protein